MARANPPEEYKLSRAAMRDRYGSRSIDARSKQSPLDSTPSGREARVLQAGGTPQEAAQFAAEQFQNSFSPRQQVFNQQPIRVSNYNPPALQNKSPFASPEDIASMVQSGASGTVQTPYGPVTLGLLPESKLPATELAPFVPQTNSPLSSFNTPNRLFGRPSRWDTSIFG